MNLDPQLLRSEQHREVGHLLQRDAGRLIERWTQRAMHEQPNAARAHHQALLDHLPHLLHALGQSLASSLGPHAAPHHDPATEHGAQRWEAGWSLPEVVRDYQILRLVVMEYLQERMPRPLHYREEMAIGLALDEAISASVSAYVRQQEISHREQTEALKESDRRKNEFLAILAHELRNPLAPILTSIELFRLVGPADPHVKQAGEIIERQVRYMVRLVDDLLDLTRITQGKLQLRRTTFEIGQAINQAVQTVRPLFDAQGHQLTVEQSPEPIYLQADEARVVQVLINLLGNAGKYTERGGQVMLTSARSGNEAVLRVRDNGVGIEADMLGRIFDLFTQVGRSLHRSQGGLGIGLTLVRQLVALHGGTVSAHSEGPGKGSEFTVRLPLSPTPPTPAASAAPMSKAAGCSILIVEDNPDARETLATLLQMLGHRTELAANGVEGISRATTARPQVALIDLGLPDVDGLQVARRIREALGEAILLIALTGHAQEEDRRRAEEAGFNAHLPKPVEIEELNRILAGVKH